MSQIALSDGRQRLGVGGMRSHVGLLLGVLAACLPAGLTFTSTAGASFSRQFERAISGAPAAPFEYAQGPRGAEAGGVAVDSADRLWVGSGVYPKVKLARFAPASVGPGNAYEETMSTESWAGPASIAIDGGDDRVLVTGSTGFDPERNELIGEPTVDVLGLKGEFIERWRRFGNVTHIAVDTSAEPLEDPSACGVTCVVYVSHETGDPAAPGGDGLVRGVEKLSDTGTALPFTGPKGEAVHFSYVSEGEIIGTPVGSGAAGCVDSTFKGAFASPGPVTVDTAGNIYVAVAECGVNEPAVIEYRPSGEFVRVIGGQETPGVAGNSDLGGFGGTITGLSYDHASGHVLVAIARIRAEAGVTEAVGAVDEFEATTGRYIAQITESEAGNQLQFPSAVATDSQGTLYVSDQQQSVVNVYSPGHFVPTVRIAGALTTSPSSATFGGEVNPEGLGITECKFEYVTGTAFKATGFSDLSSGGTVACEPAAGSISGGHGFVPVTAHVNGLSSGIDYRYRLVATSGGELGGAAVSPPIGFTAPHEPKISSESVSGISSHFATVSGSVSPLGADAEYWLEYVPQSQFEATGFGGARQTPHVDLGAGGPNGDASERVEVQLGALEASTTYEVRLSAANSVGETRGAVVAFTTVVAPVSGLADGRQYELVTPAVKDGGSDMFGGREVDDEIHTADIAQLSESGDQALLETHAGFGPFPGSETSAYVLSRDRGGWGYRSLAAPALGVQNIGGVLTSPANFETVAIDDRSGSLASEEGQTLVNLVGPAGGPYMTLHESDPVKKKEAQELKLNETNVVGASRDMTHVILDGPSSLCAGASHVKAGGTLCEWTKSSSELKLVDVNSSGVVISNCGAVLGKGRVGGRAYRAVSPDGSQVVFTAPDPTAENEGPACWNGGTVNAPQLYLRAGGETAEISAPEAGVNDPTGQHVAEYAGASEDDRHIFFLTQTELTGEARTLGLHDRELYEYDTVEKTVTRVSRGETGIAGAVEAVPAVSADGSTVYFMSYAALAPGAEAYPEPPGASEGTVNLYRYDTTSRSTTFVAAIGSYDYVVNNGVCAALGEGIIGQSTSLCPTAEWQTTPDGRYVLFDSVRSLAGASTESSAGCTIVGAQGNATGHCDQLYEYDAVSDRITCVSCNPSGANPESNAEFAAAAPTSAASGGVTAMSNDGAYVFFQTKDALVPEDANNTLDVYEWHDGMVSLISAGTAAGPSFFLDATQDGKNVLFGTHARLVPTDTDNDGDVYDARVCSASEPCVTYATGGKPECEGGACQVLAPQPAPESPASLAPSGGNPGAASETAGAKATVKTRAARGARFVVIVTVPTGGTLVLAGGSVKRMAKKLTSAGSYRLTVVLTREARSRLRRRHGLNIRLALSFTAVDTSAAGSTRAEIKLRAR